MPFVAPGRQRPCLAATRTVCFWSRALAVLATLSAVVCGGWSRELSAQTPLTNLLNVIQAAPEGEWRRVNLNSFSEVWTPPELRPLYGASNPNPSSIINAWSSFAWDSTRGDLWIFGGGHANYPGNDTYRWRGSTQRWERASLPSEIVALNIPTPSSGHYEAIDGGLNAPASAHTYDNNLYLPRIDRFITFGGASFNAGGSFIRRTSPTTIQSTGPYLFDPNRADGNKVGGTTGSHVKRHGPYPEIVGGQMWSNRDVFTGSLTPISGMTAYAEEGGKDIVYLAFSSNGGTNIDLYRYAINDLNSPAADTIAQVGRFWNGSAQQGAGAYDPARKLFVRTGEQSRPFVYWDLSGVVGPGNEDLVAVPVVQGGPIDFDELSNYGIDFDPVRDAFVLWGGGSRVWELLPPGRSGSANWLLRAMPNALQTPVPYALPASDTGVLGKWKYASNLDAFVALQDPNLGNVWVYKPIGWRDPRGGGTNQAPLVSITAPSNGATFAAPATISLSASASDADGTISKVEYFAGSTLLGQGAGTSFAFTWSNVAAGNHVLTARATDNQGAVGTSTPVGITVSAPNSVPTVSLTGPANNANFTAPATINLTASAADADGSVSSVEFYVGTTLLNTDTVAPYAFSWSGVPAGSYVLTARAIDNVGASTTSAPINVTVGPPNAPPSVAITSPVSGMSFNAPAAISISTTATDSDGSIARVDFYSGATLIGTASAAPFNFAWTNVPAGNYSLTARATDNQGATASSAAVSVTVVAPNVPPTVSLTSPANGASFTAPATIALAATAADSDGSIAKVEFFAGSTLLHTATSAPYSFSWSNVAAGLYAFTARATDNRGATTTSSSISVTVTSANAPPAVALTSPANGATFTAPATIALSAAATDSDGTITKVEFLAGATVLATVSAPPYSFNWSNVAAGSYSLSARAFDNQNASTTSAPVSITVANAIPSAPSGLSESAITRTGVTLSWVDNSANETQFRIQRSTNERRFNRIATVGANITSYTVSGLTPNTTYYFRVVAANSVGVSAPSNVVRITTLP